MLYNVGLDPPLRGNNHYFDPEDTYNRTGALANYFDDVPPDQIQPGDIFATTVHMEIVTSRLTSGRTFSSIGAGRNGVGVSQRSGVSVSGKRFRRVRTS